MTYEAILNFFRWAAESRFINDNQKYPSSFLLKFHRNVQAMIPYVNDYDQKRRNITAVYTEETDEYKQQQKELLMTSVEFQFETITMRDISRIDMTYDEVKHVSLMIA